MTSIGSSVYLSGNPCLLGRRLPVADREADMWRACGERIVC
jgi:hypothetical protein